LDAENLYNGKEVVGCRFTFWLPVNPLLTVSSTPAEAAGVKDGKSTL
jgi:hypothetical protein